jgi:hypothetical protein
MIKSSHLSTKATISSVLGTDYTEPATGDEKELRHGGMVQDLGEMYADSDEETDDLSMDDDSSQSEEEEEDFGSAAFSPFCEKVMRKQELPTPLFAGKIFDDEGAGNITHPL